MLAVVLISLCLLTSFSEACAKTSKAEKKAMKVAKTIVKEEFSQKKTKRQKLWAAYQYVVYNTKYNANTPAAKGSKDWEAKCAYATLTTGLGECYGFAAAFVYLAKAIGYEDAHVCYGSTMSASYPWAPHGWAEIKMKDGTYLFDPEIEYKNKTCGKLYRKKYEEVARKYRKEMK